MHWDTFKQDNYSTVGGDRGCRVDKVRASTSSPMPDHKGSLTLNEVLQGRIRINLFVYSNTFVVQTTATVLQLCKGDLHTMCHLSCCVFNICGWQRLLR